MISEFTSARGNGVSKPIDPDTPKKWESSASGRGLIPKARIKTIKMTLVIVLGKFLFTSGAMDSPLDRTENTDCKTILNPSVKSDFFAVFILCWSPFFVFDLLDVYGHIPMSQEKVCSREYMYVASLKPVFEKRQSVQC